LLFGESYCGQALVQELCALLVVRIRSVLLILRKTLSVMEHEARLQRRSRIIASTRGLRIGWLDFGISWRVISDADFGEARCQPEPD
jgi:hypothetical protein